MVHREVGNAGHEADHQQPAIPAHAPPDLLEHLATHRVVGDVDTLSVGQLPDPLDQVVDLAVVDDEVRPQLSARTGLLGPTCNGDHGRPGSQTQLDCSRAGPTGSAGDQQGLALCKARPVVERIPGGAVVERNRRRLGGRQGTRNGEQPVGRHSHLLGQAAAHSHNKLTRLKAVDTLTRCHHGPGGLATGGERQRWLELVLPTALEHVGKRKAHRAHIKEHLTRPGFGPLHVLEQQVVDGFTQFMYSPCTHGRRTYPYPPLSSYAGLRPGGWPGGSPRQRLCRPHGPGRPRNR